MTLRARPQAYPVPAPALHLRYHAMMGQGGEVAREKARGGILVAVLFLALGGAFGGLYWLGESSTGGAQSPAIPPQAGLPVPYGATYTAGPRPQRDGPIRDLFKTDLPNFVVALDAKGRWAGADLAHLSSEMKQEKLRLLETARDDKLPEEALESLEALLDASLVAACTEESSLGEAAEALMKRILELNSALASLDLAFFVDAEILSRQGSRTILLFSFEVMRVVTYRSGSLDVQTLHVRRLDTLNWRYRLLGFTSPMRRDAVVLDNKVDEHLLSLLPVLSEKVRIDPFDLPRQDTYTKWYTTARRRAQKVVANELGKAGPKVAQLGDLIARRQEIYQNWSHLLSSRRMSLDVPTSIDVPWNYRQQMQGLVTHASINALDKIQEQLTSKRMRRTFAQTQDLFAQSVERHETQHRLDLSHLYLLPMPEELSQYVGALPEGFQGDAGLASSALAETSAYLSELARDPLTPRINLTLLARYMFNKSAWGMGESYAALAIFEGLAADLGIDHAPLVAGRRINREAVANLYMAFTALDPDTLQDASMTLWARFFKTDLPVLEQVLR